MPEQTSPPYSTERQFRRIAKQSPIGIYIVQDGRFVFINPRFKHYIGYTWTELLKIPPNEIVHPEDRNHARQSAIRMLKFGGIEPYQYRALHKNGKVLWILETVSSMKYSGRRAVVGNFLDYTDQKTAELAHRRLAAAVENAADSIVIADPDGTIQYVNPSFEKTTLFSKNDIVGKYLQSLDNNQSDPTSHMEIWEAISSGQTWDGTTINRRKDGTLYEERGSISPVFNEERQIVNYVVVKRDITEERLLEKQLDQARRLEALGTLAGGVAHEINTPTQYVADNLRFLNRAFGDLRTYLDLCGRMVDGANNGGIEAHLLTEMAETASTIDLEFLQEEITPALTQSLEGLETISRIVLSMKEFSHPGTKEKIPVDINKAIESTLTVSRNEWKYVADLDLNLDPTLPLVVCLPGELNQALLNMVVNAAHAIEKVVGCDSGRKGRIGVSTHHTGNWAEIKIEDDGSGIPGSIQEHIFNPFFTTKEAGKGTGQGLAIAHTVIVEKHDGQIYFHSTPGKGTCFIVKLPIGTNEPCLTAMTKNPSLGIA